MPESQAHQRAGAKEVPIADEKRERGYRTIKLTVEKTELSVHTSPRIAHALQEITKDMTLYEGVRFGQILKAVYVQGQKDGAAAAFAELDKGVQQAKKLVPHKRPGRPRGKR